MDMKMTMEVDFSKVLRRGLKHGGEFAEIFLEETITSSIVCEDDRIERIIAGRDVGVGLRVIFDHKTSYGYCNALSEKSLLELASSVSSAVRGGSKGVTIQLPAEPSSSGLEVRVSPDTVSISQKVAMVQRANERARSRDRRVRQAKVVYRDFNQKVTVANSEGILVDDNRIGTLFFVHVVSVEDGITQTGYEPVGGSIGFELFDRYPPEQVADIATNRSLLMLGAREAPMGRMPVVLSSEAGGTMIHEAIGHGLEADLVQQGLSVYAHRVGDTVASSAITVVDDSTLPQKRGSFCFDDEGIPSQRTVLVDKGILQGYLFDRLTARRDGVRSTGNGRRESYRFKPIPRMTNTLIAPGSSNPEDIIHSVNAGLFVKKMGGGQVDTVNGNFVFEVNEGYLIANGRIGDPVRGATLTGNGPEIIKQIDMVGDDIGFTIGTCGKEGQGVPVASGQPTLRIPEIVVGGKAQ
jgi:TldD protein